MFLKKKQGFTLIELLIVIGIIAILAVAVIIIASPAEKLAETRDTTREKSLIALEKALYVYNLDKGSYPETVPSYLEEGEKEICNTNIIDPEDTAEICATEDLVDLSILVKEGYLGSIPVDPRKKDHEVYGTGYWVASGSILLWAPHAEKREIMRGTIAARPTQLTTEVDLINARVILTWKGYQDGLPQYSIYRKGSLQEDYGEPLDTISDAGYENVTYYDTTVSSGETYYYIVTQALTPERESTPSNEASVTYAETLSTPLNLTLEPLFPEQDGSVTWDSVANAEEYRARIFVNDILEQEETTPNSPFTIDKTIFNINDTVVVHVRAEATGYVASSYAVSNEMVVDKGTQSAPSAPTMSSSTSSSITLNAISNGEYRRDGGTWQDSTTFSDLAPGTDYSFNQRYKETTTHYASPESSAASFTTLCDLPSAPGTPTVTIYSETALDLAWTIPSSDGGCAITGYRIERGGSVIVSDTGSATLSYRNTGLTTNTEYAYRIAAINAAGVGSYSSSASKFTGHCYTTTGSCPTGYTTILGGSQSGCATAGPITSPYPGSSSNRYRIISNGQTLTESGCDTTGSQQRTRQASISSNSGSTWTFVGSTVNCRSCVRGAGCRFNGCYCTFWSCRWASRYVCYNGGYWCPSNVYLDCTSAIKCSYDHGCGGIDRWNRSCSNQTATISWCCR